MESSNRSAPDDGGFAADDGGTVDEATPSQGNDDEDAGVLEEDADALEEDAGYWSELELLKSRVAESELELLKSRFAEMEARAALTGLAVTRQESEGKSFILIHFADAPLRFGSRMSIGSLERADEMLAFPFEQYRLVPGYSAALILDTGVIEARVRPLGRFSAFGWRGRWPFREHDYVLSGEPRHPGKTIELTTSAGPPAQMLGAHSAGRAQARSILTVRFRGFGATSVEAAKVVLDEVGAALLFDLDLVYGVPLEFAPAEERRQRPPDVRSPAKATPAFPHNTYDPEPLALYMYGREAQGMPLLQFLAYYQAVEFYFPRYSEAELRRSLEAIVKDPRFNPHDERDIGGLLHTAIGEGGRGFGSERDQLKATIRACVQADEVVSFVGSDDERTRFLADRSSSLTRCVITLRDQTTDVRDAAAARIYDLRCKIVHTKDSRGQNDVELLLPNSPEARLLRTDIELLELIATRVIVASSRELRA